MTVTEKHPSVTENGRDVTNRDRDTPRARPRNPFGVVSRLSRVTDNSVTVTVERDSDSHSPLVRDRHGHPDILAVAAPVTGSEKLSRDRYVDIQAWADTEQRLSRGCAGNCDQGRACTCSTLARARISPQSEALLKGLRDAALIIGGVVLLAMLHSAFEAAGLSLVDLIATLGDAP